jgi:hypothetical protein
MHARAGEAGPVPGFEPGIPQTQVWYIIGWDCHASCVVGKNGANPVIDDVRELLFQLGMSVRPVVQLLFVVQKFMKVELFVFVPKTSHLR